MEWARGRGLVEGGWWSGRGDGLMRGTGEGSRAAEEGSRAADEPGLRAA